MHYNWYDLEVPSINWLVYGLIPSDGYVSIVGKPKAGKSSFTRYLVSCIIKGNPFLGRAVNVGTKPGRVLYVHLDRKDSPARIANEFKLMGVTKEESKRLTLRTAQHIPNSFDERLAWLQKETESAKPHLIVIDLMWQFVVANNSNDYNAVLDGINKLQDSLIKISYSGALLVTMHGRKATNINDPFDDMLGSTGQRGSFSTNVMLTRYRKDDVYTIMSDQTDRDTEHGEIEETIVERDEVGRMSLQGLYADRMKAEKEIKDEEALLRLVDFISANEGSTQPEIMTKLGMTKKTVRSLLDKAVANDQITRSGTGTKGDPYRYAPYRMETLKRPEATHVI
jgi:hypothetical protein